MTAKLTGRGSRALQTALALALAAPLTSVPLASAFADRRTESQGAYQRAFSQFERGDVRTARIELLKALKADPNNPLARLLNARVALELGAGVAAQTEIERARKIGVPREKTRHLMAHALALQGKSREALAEADASLVPPQFAAYAARIRGRAQMVAGERERARGEFELASRLAPNDPDVLADRARYEIVSGNAKQAETIVDRAVAIDPRDVRALVLKGTLVRARAGLQPALAYFNQAVQVDPDNVEALLERAGTLGDLRREDEARADLKRVQSIMPDHPLGLYLTAVLDARSGRYAQAQALMTRTRGRLDNYAPALLLQGMLAYQLNNVKAANDFLARAVARNPDYPLGRKLLASAQVRANDHDGAIRTLKPLVDANQADAQVLALYGQAHARKGDFRTAQSFLQRASKAAPASQDLRTQLAMTQAALGENNAAASTLGQVLKGNQNQPRALMALALVQLRSNEFRQALGTANQLLKAQPKSPIAHNLRGAAFLGLNDSRQAEAAFRASLETNPRFTEARRNLAQVLIATNRPAAAKVELQRILEVDNKDTRAMLALAGLAARANNSAERIQWLRQATAARPSEFAPRVALTQAYLQTNQASAGLTEARALERDFPKSAAAVELVGMANLSMRNYRDAESAFNRLGSLAPDLVGPRVLLARTQAAQRRFDDARATYNRALLVSNQNVQPVYLDLARMEAAAGRTAEATAVIERMRRAYPKSNVADLALGDLALAQGRVPQAIAAYEAARRISFDRTAATRLAGAYQRAGNARAATAVLQEYGRRVPNDPVTLVALAEMQLGMRQYRQAIASYERTLTRGGSRNPALLNNLAWAYHQAGDKRALATAEQALKLAPDAAAIQDTLGVILVDTRRDPKRGLALIERAMKASPRDPNIRFHAAVAYSANGRSADAMKQLQLALQTPQFDSRAKAAAMLNRLRNRG